VSSYANSFLVNVVFEEETKITEQLCLEGTPADLDHCPAQGGSATWGCPQAESSQTVNVSPSPRLEIPPLWVTCASVQSASP